MKKIFILAGFIGIMAVYLVWNVNWETPSAPTPDDSWTAEATFAGGCFWCTEAAFEKTHRVKAVISGYSGGTDKNPTYESVSAHKTGHLESVLVRYNPEEISFKELLDVFWRNIDPTNDAGQFVDRGDSYRTAIFYHNDEQKKLAEESKAALESSGRFSRPIVTRILPFEAFYEAEDYHQDYYKKNPFNYTRYYNGSGRVEFLKKHWEDEDSFSFTKPSDEELRKKLTPLQYNVTQEEGTEMPWDNEYLDNKTEGIYVDIVSGEPLFSSTDKYDSNTGWPSFTKPLEPKNIVQLADYRLMYPRVELRSKHADSHLGHVFEDGPEPHGLRYCINSAALRFISKEKLAEEGYEKYLNLFN